MISDHERLRRWRLVLGEAMNDDDGSGTGHTVPSLTGNDQRIDAALAAVYDERPSGTSGGRRGGLGKSSPGVVRWLGDIRRYFTTPVVHVLQRDAIDRLGLRQLLFEPEVLASVEPDVHLAALLVELNALLPDETRSTARQVVRGIVAELERRLADRSRQAVNGALARSARTRRPRSADIDWPSTVLANLRHYQPQYRTVIPDRLIGHGRHQRALGREVVIAIDQSASMAASVVYAAVFGAVLASMPALRTTIIAFDSEVTDLTELAADPVDVLFGVQLGGGTDIGQALAYAQSCITRPSESLVVLISDLYEGANVDVLNARAASLVRSGVTVVALAALSDEGAPVFDRGQAQTLADLGIPTLACTPDAFPELFAAALEGRNVATWAHSHGGAVALAAPGRDR
ncbi:MAG TPA: VWA domain-containing protein [Ilumatobacteraceae bacterium]|nr:VWA domain-containing protein [Ilumatobacteraceae bacterium]